MRRCSGKVITGGVFRDDAAGRMFKHGSWFDKYKYGLTKAPGTDPENVQVGKVQICGIPANFFIVPGWSCGKPPVWYR